MNTTEPFTRIWPAGRRYAAKLTASAPKPGEVVQCEIEWSPSMPERLSDADIAEYRSGRNAALAELGALIGGRVAVVEV